MAMPFVLITKYRRVNPEFSAINTEQTLFVDQNPKFLFKKRSLKHSIFTVYKEF